MFQAISQQHNTFIQQFNDVIQGSLIHNENIIIIIIIITVIGSIRSAGIRMLSSSHWSWTGHTAVWISVQVKTFLVERTFAFAAIEVFTVFLAEHTYKHNKTAYFHAGLWSRSRCIGLKTYQRFVSTKLLTYRFRLGHLRLVRCAQYQFSAKL